MEAGKSLRFLFLSQISIFTIKQKFNVEVPEKTLLK